MKRLKLLAVLVLELLALDAVLLILALAKIAHGACLAVLAIAKWLAELEQALTRRGRDLCNTARGWMKWAMR